MNLLNKTLPSNVSKSGCFSSNCSIRQILVPKINIELIGRMKVNSLELHEKLKIHSEKWLTHV